MSLSSPPDGFFTGVAPERYQLPHRRLGLPVILLIRRILCRAFELLRERDFQLATAKEDDVTAVLRSVIENDLRQTGEVRGFSRSTYDAVIRQGEVANYDGTHRAKTPDLCFKLRYDEFETYCGLSEFDALFVECKPVGVDHPSGSHYCDKGLIRFVNGDYAWAMQEGMMLAYVRDGRTIADHLLPAMSEPSRMDSLATTQLPIPSQAVQEAPDSRAESVHTSQHRRSFSWPDNKGPATAITVYHLWHDCG